MRSEGLWHLVEQIFGDLDHQTVEECRKVSTLWHDSLEWISLVKFLFEFGDKLAEYHRSVEEDPDEALQEIFGLFVRKLPTNEEGHILNFNHPDYLNLDGYPDFPKYSPQHILKCDVYPDDYPDDLILDCDYLDEEVLAVISAWKKGVQEYERTASIEDLRELKDSLEHSLEISRICGGHPIKDAVCDINVQFLFGTSYRVEAFRLACRHGNTKMVKLILDFSKENGEIDLNAKGNMGRTAFHLACERKNTEIAKLILDFSKENGGIDLNDADGFGNTAFHLACKENNTEIAKLILDFSKENGGIDLNAGDEFGKTAFHLACEIGNIEIAKLILDFSKENDDINLNDATRLGKTAFQLACEENNTDIAKLILEFSKQNDDLNASDDFGRTAFHLACRQGHTETARVILNFWKENGGIDLNVLMPLERQFNFMENMKIRRRKASPNHYVRQENYFGY